MCPLASTHLYCIMSLYSLPSSPLPDVPASPSLPFPQAAAHQPVSVAIEADQKAFQLYMGGVFSDETCGIELDHGVLVVGYGVDAEEGEYYIVKNSWGPEWGDKVGARSGARGVNARPARFPDVACFGLAMP